MKNIFKYFIIIFIFLFAQFLYAVKLEYKFNINDNYIIETNVKSRYYINGEFLKEVSNNEGTDYYIKSISNNFAEISARVIISEVEKKNRITKNIEKQKLDYILQKKTNGETNNYSQKIGLSSFPLLPVYDIKINDSWSIPTIINIRLFNKTEIMSLEVNVNYKLIKVDDINGKSIAFISADMTFLNDKNKEMLSKKQIFKVTGFGNFLIKFDLNEGNIQSVSETFDYLFFLHDYRIIEVAGNSFSNYKK